MKDIPLSKRGPKKSDNAHDFMHYGMDVEEIEKYLETKKRDEPPPQLIAAE